MPRPKLIIVGAGGHGRSVAEAVEALGAFELTGFLDDAWPKIKSVWQYPVLGGAADSAVARLNAEVAVVAIGNNALRRRLCLALKEAGFGLATVIHPAARVSPRATIGAGTTVMANAIVGTEAVLGEGVIVNSGAVIDHHCQVADYGHLGVGAVMAGGSELGAGAWLQAGAALGYGVKVEPDAILGPGQVRQVG